MKRALFYARDFLLFPSKFNATPTPTPYLSFIQLVSPAEAWPPFRFYTSKSDSSKTQNNKYNGVTKVEDVSKEELKRRIEKYFDGDFEAIPSIFEAILKRKLAGKHEESDDELIEQLNNKLSDDEKQEEFDSDED